MLFYFKKSNTNPKPKIVSHSIVSYTVPGPTTIGFFRSINVHQSNRFYREPNISYGQATKAQCAVIPYVSAL